MIQFNLLPNVKAEYIKAQRTQRTVMVVSCLVTAISVFILILLLVINAFQKHDLSNLISDVKQNSAKLESTPNLNQILTIQNQLKSLPGLHDQKAAAIKLLGEAGQSGYLDQITPANVTLSNVQVNFSTNTMNLSGNASGLDSINVFVDTLKFATYSTADGKVKNAKAFSNVLLSSFGASGSATYNITTNFSPDLFSEKEDVTLNIPNEVTTQSIINEPGILQSGN